MAKDQEVTLPVLDDLVKNYADGVIAQATGVWEQCDDMRKALLSGDVDRGLELMRQACPAALEDVRLVFRAKKQKFVELLRSGSNPEAALACARTELAPLALDAYPEAYGEFKRLLLLLLVPPPEGPAAAEGKGDAGSGLPQPPPQQSRQPRDPDTDLDEGMGGPGGPLSPTGSTAEFADLAFFTVRSMLGLQQPLLGLQLRFLLRLYMAHPQPASSAGAGVAAELAPRLLAPPQDGSSPASAAGAGPRTVSIGFGGVGGPLADRDPAPLPALTSGGSGPPVFPEGHVQAVIHGAGTTRAAALDALRRSGGDALLAFKAEVGRVRLDEGLLAELALEYGRFRGVLSEGQVAALEARAAGRPSPCSAAGTTAEAATGSQQRQQPQQQEGTAAATVKVGLATCSRQGSGALASGPLGQARAGAAVGSSPPSKVPRRSPPAEAEPEVQGQAGPGPRGAARDAADDDNVGSRGAEERLAEEGRGGEPMDTSAAAAGPSGEVPADAGESGSRSAGGGGGSGAAGQEAAQSGRLRGEEVLAALLRLAQADDATGVLSLVESCDPGLWEDQPGLLFDVRRCQYGKLLAAGQVTEALELARREMTPLANKHPSLLPLLKNAMAALLPPPPPPLAQPSSSSLPSSNLEQAGGAADSAPAAGAGSAGLLPSLVSVAGAIQAALQPRLGLRAPRLVRLLEGLLASHRAWMRSEKLSTDPFAGPMKITALRATGAASTSTSASVTAPAAPGAGAAAPGAGAVRAAGAGPSPPGSIAAATRALERALQRQQLLAQQLGHEVAVDMEEVVARARAEDRAAAAARGVAGAGGAAAGAAAAAVQGRHAGVAAAVAAAGERALLPEWMIEHLRRMAGGAGAGAPMDLDLELDLEEGALMEREGRHGGLRFDLGGARRGGEGHDEEEDVEDEEDAGLGGGPGGGLGVADLDEGSVLQLMEILELPRGAAIELLQNHDGDVQAAVLSVMS